MQRTGANQERKDNRLASGSPKTVKERDVIGTFCDMGTEQTSIQAAEEHAVETTYMVPPVFL